MSLTRETEILLLRVSIQKYKAQKLRGIHTSHNHKQIHINYKYTANINFKIDMSK